MIYCDVVEISLRNFYFYVSAVIELHIEKCENKMLNIRKTINFKSASRTPHTDTLCSCMCVFVFKAHDYEYVAILSALGLDDHL